MCTEGHVCLNVSAGNNGSTFNIGPYTGLLTTTGNPLNLSHYELVVEAADAGDPPATGSTTILVCIDDGCLRDAGSLPLCCAVNNFIAALSAVVISFVFI